MAARRHAGAPLGGARPMPRVRGMQMRGFLVGLDTGRLLVGARPDAASAGGNEAAFVQLRVRAAWAAGAGG